MKINPTGVPNYVTGKRRTGAAGEAFTKRHSVSSGDELTLSSDSLSFTKVFAAVKEANRTASAADPGRLSDIAARIADGTYYVDSELLASSILGDSHI